MPILVEITYIPTYHQHPLFTLTLPTPYQNLRMREPPTYPIPIPTYTPTYLTTNISLFRGPEYFTTYSSTYHQPPPTQFRHTLQHISQQIFRCLEVRNILRHIPRHITYLPPTKSNIPHRYPRHPLTQTSCPLSSSLSPHQLPLTPHHPLSPFLLPLPSSPPQSHDLTTSPPPLIPIIPNQSRNYQGHSRKQTMFREKRRIFRIPEETSQKKGESSSIIPSRNPTGPWKIPFPWKYQSLGNSPRNFQETFRVNGCILTIGSLAVPLSFLSSDRTSFWKNTSSMEGMTS